MTIDKINILWVDDEVEMLKSHVLFLEKKGYSVDTVTNGSDALEIIKKNLNKYDVIFLDESMPGITGLETLEKIKNLTEQIPVVMITKNEAEDLMEDAIGSKITDYLIKPVNPNQIILALKKILDKKRLIQEKTQTRYQQDFNDLSETINNCNSHEDWYLLYKQLIKWELELSELDASPLNDIIANQKEKANNDFSKFITSNYEDWFANPKKGPTLSHQLMTTKVLPSLSEDIPTVFLLLDNLRMDQFEVLKPFFQEFFLLVNEDYYYSILPTATQYARNAVFSGLTPLEISKYYKEYWKGENDEGGKNAHEHELMQFFFKNKYRKIVTTDYVKITNAKAANGYADNAFHYLNNDFTAVVYNFIDMLSHVRTHMEILKELASDEKAYRSLTVSWFKNSPLLEGLKKMSTRKVRLIVTTDHGTIRVNKATKVIGDKETATNIRYKVGKSLSYDKNVVMEVPYPEKVGLPSSNVSSRFVFANRNDFFLYPNNYNHYHHYYNDTFQHGGISMEEMIIPFIIFESK